MKRGNIMIFADVKVKESDKHLGGLFVDLEEVHRVYWMPLVEIVSVVDFKVTGKTYAEKQNSLRDVAIDFQNAVSDFEMFMSEWAIVSDWFAKMGKRYGLLREFRENAII